MARPETINSSSTSGRFQISTASAPATAEIDFIAKLIDKDGKIVNASTFQGSAPVKGEGAQAYVNAMDEVFAKLAGELIGWVTTALAELPPPAPPPPLEPPSDESTEAQPG